MFQDAERIHQIQAIQSDPDSMCQDSGANSTAQKALNLQPYNKTHQRMHNQLWIEPQRLKGFTFSFPLV